MHKVAALKGALVHCRADAVGPGLVEEPGFAEEPSDEDDDVGPLHRSPSQQLRSHCVISPKELDWDIIPAQVIFFNMLQFDFTPQPRMFWLNSPIIEKLKVMLYVKHESAIIPMIGSWLQSTTSVTLEQGGSLVFPAILLCIYLAHSFELGSHLKQWMAKAETKQWRRQ